MISSRAAFERFQSRELILAFSLLFLTQLIAIILGAHFELTDQEAYYWSWSQNISLGYFDHPPLLAWCLAALTKLFGSSAFVVRLPAFVGRSLCLTCFTLYAFRTLPARAALIASLLVMSTPAVLMGSMISIPDVIAVPLGLVALYLAQKGKPFFTGLLAGFALLGKWSILFVLPGIFYLLWKRCHKKAFWFFLPLLILQIPVVYWNATHDWATFIFQFFSRHERHLLFFGDYLRNIVDVFGSQLFSFGIIFLLLFLFLLPRRLKSLGLTFYFLMVPTVAGIFVSGIQGQYRYYWGCFLIFPAAYWIALQMKSWSLHRQSILIQILIANIFIIWAGTVYALFQPVGPLFDQLTRQSFRYRHSPQGEIRGWTEWANDLRDHESIDLAQSSFYATDFRVASQVKWALENSGIHSSAVGTLAPFEYRNQYRFWPVPTPLQNSILVADDRYDKIAILEKSCDHVVQWRTYKIFLQETPIKEIRWAICREMNTNYFY